MSIKNAIFLMGAMLCTAMPFQAQAMKSSSLRIVNNTDFDSTSVINSKRCSSEVLGQAGITHAHSTNVVSSTAIKLACGLNKDNCTADVYMTRDCNKSGAQAIARVTLDVNNGIKTVTPADNIPYVLTFSGFEATISPK